MSDTAAETTEIFPPGITSLKYLCWELRYANGQTAEHGDGTPHFRTEAEGAKDATHYERSDWGRPAPVQRTAPCYLAVADCGYVLDAEFMVMHHDTADEAYKTALSHDWTVRGTGMVCDPDCEECKTAPAGVSQ